MFLTVTSTIVTATVIETVGRRHTPAWGRDGQTAWGEVVSMTGQSNCDRRWRIRQHRDPRERSGDGNGHDVLEVRSGDRQPLAPLVESRVVGPSRRRKIDDRTRHRGGRGGLRDGRRGRRGGRCSGCRGSRRVVVVVVVVVVAGIVVVVVATVVDGGDVVATLVVEPEPLAPSHA